jgi:isocitrate lyase
MSMGRKFKALLKENKYLVTPGVTTPLHAMILEKTGYKFVYVGGHDVSITLLGLPDVGFLTQTEMATNARHVAESVSIPVMVDADTGYGNAVNVTRAVRDFEAAGVAAMHIEDQESPKRCGYVPGKTLVSIEEAVGKLKAAMHARKDKDFMIVGRTDAVSAIGGGLDEAIARGKAFAAAGCDMIMPIFSKPEIEQPRLFAEAIHADYPDATLYFLYASAMKWRETRIGFDEIAALGYKAMHVSLAGLRLTMQPMWDYAVDMDKRGAEAEFDLEERMIGHPMEDIFAFEGFPEIKELETKFLPADAVDIKYGTDKTSQ